MQSSNKDNLTQKRKNSLKNYYSSLGLTSNNETEKVEEKKETFLPEVTVSEKIDNTIYASLGNLAKGAIGTVEGYIDAAASAANKIGIISDSAAKNFIEKDLTTKYYNKIMPFATFMGGGSVLKYIQEYKKYGRLLTPEEKEQLSYMNTGVGQITGQVLQGVGQQLPNIGIGKLVGATAGLLGAGTKGVGIATQLGSTTAFTSSAIGSSTAEALYEGADLDEAQTYGVLSGALETGVEFLSGGIGGVGEGLLDKAIPQISKNKAVKYIVGALGEGAEEMVSEVVTPYIKRYAYDKDAELSTKEQVFEAGLIGALCGAVMETGQVLSTPKGIRVAQDIQTELEYMEKHQDNPDLVNKSYDRIQELSEKFATEMERVGMDSNVLQAEFYEKQIKQTKAKMEKESVKLKEGETSLYNEDLTRYNQSKDNAIKTMKENVRNEYLAKTNQYYKYDFNSGEKSKLYESLSQENKTKIDETVEFMNAAQSRTGTNLHLEIDFEGTNTNIGENGFIDLENNRIVLNPDNMDTRKAKNNILAHELTHLSENTKSGKKLNNYVLKHLKELGLYESEYERTYKLYENYFKDKNAEFNNLTTEEKQNYINKEIVADFVQENLFTSQESINKLANEDTSMAKSVLNWLKSKVESLSKSDKERDTQRMLKKAENMYIKALDEVKRNRQNINNDVKYSKSSKINFQVPDQFKKLSKEERYRKSLDFNDMLMKKLREDGTIRDYYFQLDSDIIYQEYASLDEDGNIEQNTPILLEIEKMTKNYGLSETDAHDIQQSILEDIGNAKRRKEFIRVEDVRQNIRIRGKEKVQQTQNISSNTNMRSSATDNRINREISESNRNTISETVREQGRVDNTKKSLNKEQQNEQTREYSDEFRRIQEESRRLFATISQQERSSTIDDTLYTRIRGVLSREIRYFNSRNSNTTRLLENTNYFKIYDGIDGTLFHDCFEISRTYLKNGELVDLHENYNDCTCYLSEDGLSGFAITDTGDLVSVFNLSKEKGFLRAIAPTVKERAKSLDCYVSPKQNLQGMYSEKFGFQTASIMDYNMEYDHDDIAQNHNMPQVAFMVNTDQQVETKNFNKDQYDEAKAYQESFIKQNEKKYSLAKSTIDKVKGQVSTNTDTLKEKTAETMLKSQIQFVDAQAGIEDAFKKLGAKSYQNISTNYARASSARGNEALRSGIFDKEGRVLSKGYDEVFVDTIPQEYMLKENADKRETYIRERNNYLFHYLNIDRMENVFYKLRTSDMEKVTLSEKGKTLIENALTESEYKSLDIDEIRDLNLSQEDLTNLEEYLRNIKSVFGEYINFNEISNEDKEYLKRNAPELYEKIKESPISESEFNKIAERYELDEQSDEIKNIKKAMREINADESRIALREIEQEHPEFKKQAKDIWDYGKALLEIEYQASLISKEAKEYLNKTYPHYVPTNRDLYGYSSKGAMSSDNSVNVSQNVKTAKGSDLLLEPIEVMLARRTMRAYKADAINTLALELENAYRTSQYNDKDSLIQFTEDIEIPKNVDNINYELLGASQDGKYVTYYENGEMKKMSVSNEIYEGFKDLSGNMRSSSYNTITKGIRKINKIFKSSITSYNPFFVARNVARDIQDALLYSKNGFGKIVTNLPKAWKQMSNNGEMWQEYLRSGGLQSSLFNFETGTETAKSISNFENKVGKKVRKVGQAIEKVNMYTEQMVRFSEYMLSREKGNSTKQALYDANEVTVNFGRGGTMTKELNATIMPFLNPATQGASKFARTFMSPKSAKEWRNLIGRVALLGIVPALFNAIAYDDDEEYQALGSYYKENYYMIKIGSNKFLRIPKGRVLALFQSTTSRTMSIKDKGFKEAFEGYGDNIETALSPVNNFRTIFSPISDVKTNTTWYGGEIESQKYSKISPKYRYDDETSAIAKLIGSTINYSPLKVDYLLDQYTGVFGDIFLSIGTTKGQTSLEDNFVIDTTYKNKYSSEFYSKLEKCEYAKSEGDVVATLKVRYLNKCKNAISDIQDQQLEIEKNTELSKEEKAAQTKVLQILLNNAFKNATENVEVLGNYLGKNCELSSVSIEDDYIEAIRQCFGAEEALRQYNSTAFSKATALQKVANIDYDTFYCVYLDCKEIESDYDKNGKAISGSKKAKIVDYINNVPNLTKTQRILLLAALGYKPNDINSVVSYLKSQSKTSNEIDELLEILNLSLTN